MITHDAPHDLLTVAEAAAELRVSKPTIRRWIASGHLPAIRRGARSIRVRRAELYAVTVSLRPRPALAMSELEAYTIHGGDPTTPWQSVLDHIRQTNDRILARRGGKPLDSSLPLIHEARSERDERL